MCHVRQASRHNTDGEELCFGGVEALPGGIAKGAHGGGDGVEGGQEGLGVISVLEGGKQPASHLDADATGLEEAQGGLHNEQVEDGG